MSTITIAGNLVDFSKLSNLYNTKTKAATTIKRTQKRDKEEELERAIQESYEKYGDRFPKSYVERLQNQGIIEPKEIKVPEAPREMVDTSRVTVPQGENIGIQPTAPLQQHTPTVDASNLPEVLQQRQQFESRLDDINRKLQETENLIRIEKGRLRGKAKNTSININSEAELRKQSPRYVQLAQEEESLLESKQEVEEALELIDSELKVAPEPQEGFDPISSANRSFSGIPSTNPMEQDLALEPVIMPAETPAARAQKTGTVGTILDPNFSLTDIAKSANPFIGINTDETISDIDSSLARMEADYRGEVEPPRPPTLDDEYEALGQSGKQMETMFAQQGPQKLTSSFEPNVPSFNDGQGQEAGTVLQTIPTEQEQPEQSDTDRIVASISKEGQRILADYEAVRTGEKMARPNVESEAQAPLYYDTAGVSSLSQKPSAVNTTMSYIGTGSDKTSLADLENIPPATPISESKSEFNMGVVPSGKGSGPIDRLVMEAAGYEYVPGPNGLPGKYEPKRVTSDQGFLFAGPYGVGTVQISGGFAGSGKSKIVDGKRVIPNVIDPTSEEGQIIQEIYARQAKDRFDNLQQQEYVAALRQGKVSIRDALLNPRTRNVYLKGDGSGAWNEVFHTTESGKTIERLKPNSTVFISEGVPKKRAEQITKYFEERGISLDEQIGSVRTGAVKYDDARAYASRFDGTTPKGDQLGNLERFVTPDIFRKTPDGKPLFASTEPTPGELVQRQVADILQNVASAKPQEITDIFGKGPDGKPLYGKPKLDSKGKPIIKDGAQQWEITPRQDFIDKTKNFWEGNNIELADNTEFVIPYIDKDGVQRYQVAPLAEVPIHLQILAQKGQKAGTYVPVEIIPLLSDEQDDEFEQFKAPNVEPTIKLIEDSVEKQREELVKESVGQVGLVKEYPWMGTDKGIRALISAVENQVPIVDGTEGQKKVPQAAVAAIPTASSSTLGVLALSKSPQFQALVGSPQVKAASDFFGNIGESIGKGGESLSKGFESISDTIRSRIQKNPELLGLAFPPLLAFGRGYVDPEYTAYVNQQPIYEIPTALGDIKLPVPKIPGLAPEQQESLNVAVVGREGGDPRERSLQSYTDAATAPFVNVGRAGIALATGESGPITPTPIVTSSGIVEGRIRSFLDRMSPEKVDYIEDILDRSIESTINPALEQISIQKDGGIAFAENAGEKYGKGVSDNFGALVQDIIKYPDYYAINTAANIATFVTGGQVYKIFNETIKGAQGTKIGAKIGLNKLTPSVTDNLAKALTFVTTTDVPSAYALKAAKIRNTAFDELVKGGVEKSAARKISDHLTDQIMDSKVKSRIESQLKQAEIASQKIARDPNFKDIIGKGEKDTIRDRLADALRSAEIPRTEFKEIKRSELKTGLRDFITPQEAKPKAITPIEETFSQSRKIKPDVPGDIIDTDPRSAILPLDSLRFKASELGSSDIWRSPVRETQTFDDISSFDAFYNVRRTTDDAIARRAGVIENLEEKLSKLKLSKGNKKQIKSLEKRIKNLKTKQQKDAEQILSPRTSRIRSLIPDYDEITKEREADILRGEISPKINEYLTSGDAQRISDDVLDDVVSGRKSFEDAVNYAITQKHLDPKDFQIVAVRKSTKLVEQHGKKKFRLRSPNKYEHNYTIQIQAKQVPDNIKNAFGFVKPEDYLHEITLKQLPRKSRFAPPKFTAIKHELSAHRLTEPEITKSTTGVQYSIIQPRFNKQTNPLVKFFNIPDENIVKLNDQDVKLIIPTAKDRVRNALLSMGDNEEIKFLTAQKEILEKQIKELGEKPRKRFRFESIKQAKKKGREDKKRRKKTKQEYEQEVKVLENAIDEAKQTHILNMSLKELSNLEKHVFSTNLNESYVTNIPIIAQASDIRPTLTRYQILNKLKEKEVNTSEIGSIIDNPNVNTKEYMKALEKRGVIERVLTEGEKQQQKRLPDVTLPVTENTKWKLKDTNELQKAKTEALVKLQKFDTGVKEQIRHIKSREINIPYYDKILPPEDFGTSIGKSIQLRRLGEELFEAKKSGQSKKVKEIRKSIKELEDSDLTGKTKPGYDLSAVTESIKEGKDYDYVGLLDTYTNSLMTQTGLKPNEVPELLKGMALIKDPSAAGLEQKMILSLKRKELQNKEALGVLPRGSVKKFDKISSKFDEIEKRNKRYNEMIEKYDSLMEKKGKSEYDVDIASRLSSELVSQFDVSGKSVKETEQLGDDIQKLMMSLDSIRTKNVLVSPSEMYPYYNEQVSAKTINKLQNKAESIEKSIKKLDASAADITQSMKIKRLDTGKGLKEMNLEGPTQDSLVVDARKDMHKIRNDWISSINKYDTATERFENLQGDVIKLESDNQRIYDDVTELLGNKPGSTRLTKPKDGASRIEVKLTGWRKIKKSDGETGWMRKIDWVPLTMVLNNKHTQLRFFQQYKDVLTKAPERVSRRSTAESEINEFGSISDLPVQHTRPDSTVNKIEKLLDVLDKRPREYFSESKLRNLGIGDKLDKAIDNERTKLLGLRNRLLDARDKAIRRQSEEVARQQDEFGFDSYSEAIPRIEPDVDPSEYIGVLSRTTRNELNDTYQRVFGKDEDLFAGAGKVIEDIGVEIKTDDISDNALKRLRGLIKEHGDNRKQLLDKRPETNKLKKEVKLYKTQMDELEQKFDTAKKKTDRLYGFEASGVAKGAQFFKDEPMIKLGDNVSDSTKKAIDLNLKLEAIQNEQDAFLYNAAKKYKKYIFAKSDFDERAKPLERFIAQQLREQDLKQRLSNRMEKVLSDETLGISTADPQSKKRIAGEVTELITGKYQKMDDYFEKKETLSPDTKKVLETVGTNLRKRLDVNNVDAENLEMLFIDNWRKHYNRAAGSLQLGGKLGKQVKLDHGVPVTPEEISKLQHSGMRKLVGPEYPNDWRGEMINKRDPNSLTNITNEKIIKSNLDGDKPLDDIAIEYARNNFDKKQFDTIIQRLDSGIKPEILEESLQIPKSTITKVIRFYDDVKAYRRSRDNLSDATHENAGFLPKTETKVITVNYFNKPKTIKFENIEQTYAKKYESQLSDVEKELAKISPFNKAEANKLISKNDDDFNRIQTINQKKASLYRELDEVQGELAEQQDIFAKAKATASGKNQKMVDIEKELRRKNPNASQSVIEAELKKFDHGGGAAMYDHTVYKINEMQYLNENPGHFIEVVYKANPDNTPVKPYIPLKEYRQSKSVVKSLKNKLKDATTVEKDGKKFQVDESQWSEHFPAEKIRALTKLQQDIHTNENIVDTFESLSTGDKLKQVLGGPISRRIKDKTKSYDDVSRLSRDFNRLFLDSGVSELDRAKNVVELIRGQKNTLPNPKKVGMLAYGVTAKNKFVRNLKEKKYTWNLERKADKLQKLQNQMNTLSRQELSLRQIPKPHKKLYDKLGKTKSEIVELKNDLTYAKSERDLDKVSKLYDTLKKKHEEYDTTFDKLLNARGRKVKSKGETLNYFDINEIPENAKIDSVILEKVDGFYSELDKMDLKGTGVKTPTRFKEKGVLAKVKGPKKVRQEYSLDTILPPENVKSVLKIRDEKRKLGAEIQKTESDINSIFTKMDSDIRKTLAKSDPYPLIESSVERTASSGYVHMISRLSKLESDLQSALLKNDQKTAAKLRKEISLLKKEIALEQKKSQLRRLEEKPTKSNENARKNLSKEIKSDDSALQLEKQPEPKKTKSQIEKELKEAEKRREQFWKNYHAEQKKRKKQLEDTKRGIGFAGPAAGAASRIFTSASIIQEAEGYMTPPGSPVESGRPQPPQLNIPKPDTKLTGGAQPSAPNVSPSSMFTGMKGISIPKTYEGFKLSPRAMNLLDVSAGIKAVQKPFSITLPRTDTVTGLRSKERTALKAQEVGLTRTKQIAIQTFPRVPAKPGRGFRGFGAIPPPVYYWPPGQRKKKRPDKDKKKKKKKLVWQVPNTPFGYYSPQEYAVQGQKMFKEYSKIQPIDI